MDVEQDMQEKGIDDPNRKRLKLCAECHQVVSAELNGKSTKSAVEKRINRLGVLCCLSAWWLCCIGVVFCLMMRSEFCNNCYKEKFLMKAHERRRLQLYMDDRSLCEPPSGVPEKPTPRRYIVQPK